MTKKKSEISTETPVPTKAGVEAFRITGGKPLSGEIQVEGSKNAALPILMATIIEKGTYTIRNVPKLRDVRTSFQLLEHLGLKIKALSDNDYEIKNPGLKTFIAPYEIVKKMRASFLAMGAILAYANHGTVSLPGGCNIGQRPVDLHIKGFQSLGAKLSIENGYVIAEKTPLVGSTIALDKASVGATENIILAAVKAKGKTTITNAAREPEIVDLCDFLTNMGAKITGAGTGTIEIEGVKKLVPCEHTVQSDRIAAGTYIILSVLFDGKIVIKGVNGDHLGGFLVKLEEMGVKTKLSNNGTLKVLTKLSDVKGGRVQTMPFPGFPTDLQSPIMALMCFAKGSSEIKETIFENRFMHVPELNRMGAHISVDGSLAKIEGVKSLSSAEVMASDLRAGAALLLAALKAKGTTLLNRIYHIDRGYEEIDKKLALLGAKIERIKIEL